VSQCPQRAAGELSCAGGSGGYEGSRFRVEGGGYGAGTGARDRLDLVRPELGGPRYPFCEVVVRVRALAPGTDVELIKSEFERRLRRSIGFG